MFNIGELVKNLPDIKPTKRISERAILLIKIAELVEMTHLLESGNQDDYWRFAGKFKHLKKEEGFKKLKRMYETALGESGEEDGKWRRIKFWTLLRESHEQPLKTL